MRPRHYCRGRDSLAAERKRAVEASMRPRHYCRGRCSTTRTRLATRTGFNEAAALLPRKGPYLGVVLLGILSASMRPRHYCRGRSRSTRCLAPSPPRFNEAAALLPRKDHLFGCQFRHGTRFNEAAALLPRKEGRSMRHIAEIPQASMRPRHYCRGRHNLLRSYSKHGLCFNEAAALLPRKGDDRAAGTGLDIGLQ